MILNPIGKIAQKYWLEIPNHFSNVKLDAFVIMPDHIHGILVITHDKHDKTATFGCNDWDFVPNDESYIKSDRMVLDIPIATRCPVCDTRFPVPDIRSPVSGIRSPVGARHCLAPTGELIKQKPPPIQSTKIIRGILIIPILYKKQTKQINQTQNPNQHPQNRCMNGEFTI